MDWIKQNKFLTGFLAFLIVAGGALGFLAFSAKSKYDEAYGAYQTKAQELNGLQTQQPYPDEANVAKMQQLQKDHQAAIDSLQKELAKAQIPLKQVTPEKFQDNLRETVRRVSAKAAEHNTTMPKEKFYMGFEAYQGVPPKPEATPELQRTLEAMELAMNILLDSGIAELKDIKREPLPEEGGGEKSSGSAPKEPKGGKGKTLEQRHSFDVEFVAAETQLRRFVNELILSKQQFYVPKSFVIANEKDKGPPKIDPNAQPADPNKPVPSGPEKYIVGDEKLNVAARIEIVEFAEPTAK